MRFVLIFFFLAGVAVPVIVYQFFSEKTEEKTQWYEEKENARDDDGNVIWEDAFDKHGNRILEDVKDAAGNTLMEQVYKGIDKRYDRWHFFQLVQ